MYIYEQDDLELDIDIKEELKSIAKGLGFTYIEKNPVVNTNKSHNGLINVGSAVINISYKTYINSISVSIEDNIIDCTDGIKDITNLSVDLQTASMIIKSIQESNMMD